ncbi:serine protease, partial [Candidatus Parcubacteria bacterium]|nr:serine protease [Candidatus Parcubacteria bacterium]
SPVWYHSTVIVLIANFVRKILFPMAGGIIAAFAVAVLTAPKTEYPIIEIPIVVTSVATTTVTKVSPVSLKPKATSTAVKAKENPVLAMKRSLLSRILAGDTLKEADVNETARAATINIYCTARGDIMNPLSGTGIIISKDGYVLTNAHVAQYLLLSDRLDCVGRNGSPAKNAYALKFAYFPKSWLDANAKKILDENATSTGEGDFAILAITEVLGQPYPSEFPSLAPEFTDVFVEGTPLLLAAYPAGFLGGITLGYNLWLTSSVSQISKLYYFNDGGSTDLFSMDGNILSQKGASGGGAVSLLSGKLLGILTTVTEAETTGGRELMALSIPYIAGKYERAEGESLGAFLSRSPAENIARFEARRKELAKELVDTIAR